MQQGWIWLSITCVGLVSRNVKGTRLSFRGVGALTSPRTLGRDGRSRGVWFQRFRATFRIHHIRRNHPSPVLALSEFHFNPMTDLRLERSPTTSGSWQLFHRIPFSVPRCSLKPVYQRSRTNQPGSRTSWGNQTSRYSVGPPFVVNHWGWTYGMPVRLRGLRVLHTGT